MADCPSCGTSLSDGAGYCYVCGAQFPAGSAGAGAAPPLAGNQAQWSPPGPGQPPGPSQGGTDIPGWPQPEASGHPGAAAPTTNWQPVPGTAKHLTVQLAVKCDLCRNLAPMRDGSARAACVASCPTGAIVRVNPRDYVDELIDRA